MATHGSREHCCWIGLREAKLGRLARYKECPYNSFHLEWYMIVTHFLHTLFPWKKEQPVLSRDVIARSKSLRCLAVHRDADILATCTSDCTLRVFDAITGDQMMWCSFRSREATALDLQPTSLHLSAALRSSSIGSVALYNCVPSKS